MAHFKLVRFGVLVALVLVLLVSCYDGSPKSPNGRFKAVRDGSHCKVVEISTGKTILTSHAQYTTPNDVKACAFSPDSKKFAAVYHYSHRGDYSWFGVWSTETGKFLYEEGLQGFHLGVPPGVFHD